MEKVKELLSKIKIGNLAKKNIKGFLIIIFVILVLYFIITSIINGSRNRTCNNLRNDILSKSDSYFEENNLLPTLNGDSITIKLSDLNEAIVFKDYALTGTITYTKYNDEYVKTVKLDDASYCTTKDFTKEGEYDSSKNVEVTTLFNYFEVDSYNSKWSNWYPSEDISTEETDGVLLPLDSKKLPVIPKNAVITEYVRETKTYYSYRDQRWKWYKNNIKYSDYSSTKPSGYTYKDEATKSKTEETPWSLDYPETFDYRHIRSTVGYRWYYLDGETKVYWNNGEYTPNSPGNEYEKEFESSATMYTYYDDIWKWYNGNTKRIYSSYSSTKPIGYNYKDEDTLSYTNWTVFKNVSYVDNSNKSYREEQTDIYSRYLIKYDIYSLPMLENYITLEELENKLGKSYEEISEDKSIKVDVSFTFKYE